jgi:threonine synthase
MIDSSFQKKTPLYLVTGNQSGRTYPFRPYLRNLSRGFERGHKSKLFRFRIPETTPLITLNENEHLYLPVLFQGPTFAFEDVALQLLGNLFEHFLIRMNKGNIGKDRHHLGATSGDA